MKSTNKEVRITFRVPADIYEKIAELAKISRRSINGEMVIALEEFIEKHKK